MKPHHNVPSWSDKDLLILRSLPRMTTKRFRFALEHTSCLEHFLSIDAEQPSATLRMELGSEMFNIARVAEEADRILERCARSQVAIVSICNDQYPRLLRQIPYPPNLLFVRGMLQHPDALSLSIVGTRQCTQYGQAVTEEFARECGRAGLIITSGLAAGIDSIAHKAAVESGAVTYAVIACGIDMIGPSYAARLALAISDNGGAIISEYPCGVRALPAYFPQRNRIISGISRALLVVESGKRGGSLITAQFAMDQSREVYAVPGMISAERSMGTNALIANNTAIAALSPSQILLDYGIDSAAVAQPAPEFGSELEQRVFENIDHRSVHLDDVAEQLAASSSDVLVCALTLEFKGYVRQLPGRMFVRMMKIQ
ncbi:MAG: DNA-processing protein DprA [Candidatus Kapaibacterium sp.]